MLSSVAACCSCSPSRRGSGDSQMGVSLPLTGADPVALGGDAHGLIAFGPMRLKLPKPLVLAINLSVVNSNANTDCQRVAHDGALRAGFVFEVLDYHSNAENYVTALLERAYTDPSIQACVVLMFASKSTKFDTLIEAVHRSSVACETLSPFLALVSERKLTTSEETALYESGLHRHYQTNALTVNGWFREFTALRRYTFPQQTKVRAAQALFTALDQSENPIQITDADNVVQFVNVAFEQAMCCGRAEAIGFVALDPARPRRMSADSQLLESDEDEAGLWKTVPVCPIAAGGSGSIHGGPLSQPVTPSQITQQCVSQYVRYRQNSQPHIVTRDATTGQLVGRVLGQARQSVTNVKTPISEILVLLREVQKRSESNEEIQKPLLAAMRMLSSADLYAPILSRLRAEDRASTDLLSGLVTNSPVAVHQGMKLRKQSLVEAMRLNTGVHSPGGLAQTTMAARGATPDICASLATEATWEFDILELERVTVKRPLVHLGMKTFERWKVREFLQCSEGTLRGWVHLIESYYHGDNPYHNSTHAADVLQASAYYLGKPVIGNTLQLSEAVAVLIAAMVHDLDHPGKTSAFLINSRNHLAILYNDVSVLESHHASLTFDLTWRDPHVNIFQRLSRQDYNALRKLIVDMVLATDMNRHFEYFAKFQSMAAARFEDTPDSPNLPNRPNLPSNITGATSANESSNGKVGNNVNSKIPNLGSSAHDKADVTKTVLRVLIKCADVSNPTRPWHMCKEWASRIVEEYCRQTEEEKAKNLPLSMPVFDRETCNLPLTQVRFIDMFVKEMFETWTKFGEMPELWERLEDNYQRWSEQCESLQSTGGEGGTVAAVTASTEGEQGAEETEAKTNGGGGNE